jgi:3-hydroxybutyryl-CoA dehydrogenase
MGSGIAQAFAQAGFEVLLFDVSAAARDGAEQSIARSVSKLAQKGVIAAASVEPTLRRLSYVTRLDLIAPVDFVVEAVVEDLSAKDALFRDLHALVAPAVVLASNTSSISITRLAAASGRPARVVGMHFMNPVPLMPLVELVRGHATDDHTMAMTRGLVSAMGKTAVEAADYPGFIANRILMPMINEAIFALMEGVGTAEAIDAVMKLGMSHPMGPLALADRIGLDVCLAILEVMQEGLGDPKYRPCPLLRRMVAAGQLGRKTGRGFFTYA